VQNVFVTVLWMNWGKRGRDSGPNQTHSLRHNKPRSSTKSLASSPHVVLTAAEILPIVSELHIVSEAASWQTRGRTCRSQLHRNR
jgi:hypothetical protein